MPANPPKSKRISPRRADRLHGPSLDDARRRGEAGAGAVGHWRALVRSADRQGQACGSRT
jgi:hypothetical protein